jgi:hypothetical protein
MKMKKVLKWIGIILGCILIAGFLAFLYFIPPFTSIPPEAFIEQTASAGPSLDDIRDPRVKMLAERGKYLVTIMDCSGCHTPQGDEGPDWSKYLAGGMKLASQAEGAVVSRNLTPDSETGLARRTDTAVKRMLRSGVRKDGSIASFRAMPWGTFSNLTEEDRHAVVVYLRHLKPVRHTIPEAVQKTVLEDPDAAEAFYVYDYAIHQEK